ncbi:riboflavin synthase [Sphingobium sp. OAS761]|uniref:riboflavin synthase n=1 Tax=Sphingobium sp. OAS761 TaxID=2817901 RepID=UPI0020A03055|nr:riboflavin synthase [Sphingobium sp. OAS761]MCP1469974.1 riboflavin synthase [Sphingobium sp. OAS761]
MFTGIITDIGTIRARDQRGDLRLVIGCAYAMDGVAIGASIACSGVCLTVVEKGADWFAVDLSAETVARTAPGLWSEGNRLNLERALKVGDELGGHIVTGHVDGIGRLVSATPEGDSLRLVIGAPPALAAALAAKGSITVDGISLTVNHVADQPDGSVHFGLNIIPHTAAATTLDALPEGRAFNLEIDVLARYLDRMQAVRNRTM